MVELNELQGLWRRTLIAWPGDRFDTTTEVYWLQGPSRYADLRIPAGRPKLEGAACLRELDWPMLRFMALQEGFIGHLELSHSVAHWHRTFDYQPASGANGEIPFFGDNEYGSLYWDAVERLGGEGAEIVPIDFAPFAKAASLLYGGPWVAERLVAAGDLLERRPEAIHTVLRGILHDARAKTASQAFQAFYDLAGLIREAERAWSKMDCLLLPTAGTTFTIAEMLADPVELNTRLGAYTNFVNLMDLAAIAVPAGLRSDGIPFGVTLIGPALSEGMLAFVGDALHRSLTGASLGATSTPLSSTPPLKPPERPAKSVEIAVVGAHLSGQPLNGQLVERNAKLLETARTGAGYRLYAFTNGAIAKPGLVFDGDGPGGIEVELWQMDHAGFGSFVALIPPPLGIGAVTLADGRIVKGFLCEAHAARNAEDITAFGGWRAWLNRPSGT